tara:strand:- start:1498 stop:1629 length:132 start_codon:yes stop_codon:yes gene_type:complete
MTQIEKTYLHARITALEKEVEWLKKHNELLTMQKERAESLLIN